MKFFDRRKLGGAAASSLHAVLDSVTVYLLHLSGAPVAGLVCEIRVFFPVCCQAELYLFASDLRCLKNSDDRFCNLLLIDVLLTFSYIKSTLVSAADCIPQFKMSKAEHREQESTCVIF